MTSGTESGTMGGEGGDSRHVPEVALSPIQALRAAEASGDEWEVFNAEAAFYARTLNARPPKFESRLAELQGRALSSAAEVEPVIPETQQLTD